MLRRLIPIVVACIFSADCRAQSPADVADFHERVVQAIREMSRRPLTPGDTFLTWNPRPGGLIHTVSVSDTTVSASLLRGDGMLGTLEVRLAQSRPVSFDVVWTTRDSATGKPLLDHESHGVVIGDSIRITGTAQLSTRIPPGVWAVADFGMEEALIPLVRSLPPGTAHHLAVFRPWHGRWDAVTVQVRDTAGVRFVDQREGIAFDSPKQTHEVLVLNAHGDLLTIVRFDQPDDRHPLEGSARWEEYRKTIPPLLPTIRQFANAPSP